MRWSRLLILAVCATLYAWASPTQPSALRAAMRDTGSATSSGGAATSTGRFPVGIAVGGGKFVVTLATGELAVVNFSMAAVATPNGKVIGRFHHQTELGGLHVEFIGKTICLAIDPVNHRAWIGGVIVENRSEHPSFTTPRTQPGKDIWFRVLDTGVGPASEDRSTFVGFEGDGGIQTSLEYCQVKIWPDGNARTWPVVIGNILVKP